MDFIKKFLIDILKHFSFGIYFQKFPTGKYFQGNKFQGR